jgi:hypothetical protein
VIAVLLFAAALTPLDIVQNAVELSEKADHLRRHYTLILEDISRSEDKTRSKTFEITYREAKQYRKLVRRDGKAVDSDPEPYTSKHDERRREMFREFAKALDFTMARDETVDGYDCWVLLAKPKPGYKPASFRTSFLTQMEGKVWISKKFNRMVKLDAVTIGPVSFGGFLAKLEPGSRVEVEQVRLQDDLWLPRRFKLTYSGRLLFKGLRGELEQLYMNYKRVSPAT